MKKLSLNRETVRRLDLLQLGNVRAGVPPTTVVFGQSGEDCGDGGGGGGGGGTAPGVGGGGQVITEDCSMWECPDLTDGYLCM